ncbi:MAG: metal-dependent phosphohydrolase [Coleofasciculus sp. C2-GNP5-27]
MFNLTGVLVHDCVERLQAGYRQTYGNCQPDYTEVITGVAQVALEQIAQSDALYHNVEHTILVTLVGQEILRGKHILQGNVSRQDWLTLIVSWLCHDIGYVKGICRNDQPDQRLYVIGLDDMMISLPQGATDASLTSYHVDRGKRFVEEYFGTHPFIDCTAVKRNIELTRFPVPADDAHQDTMNYPGLTRAADLIGQLSDPRYLLKIPALFGEFEESGANKILGYHNPGELRQNYPKFFWTVVWQYIQPALRYLEVTGTGQQIIANLYGNVLQVEQENRVSSRKVAIFV